MQYLYTEYAHKIKMKCRKSKNHEKNTKPRPRFSGVQLGDGAELRAVFNFKSNLKRKKTTKQTEVHHSNMYLVSLFKPLLNHIIEDIIVN